MQIKKHNRLEQKIWDSNNMLKRPVCDLLMLIANSYIDSIRKVQHLNIDDTDVKDVFIYGSITNYFYTNKSDIDMCIVIDFDSVAKKNPAVSVTPHSFKLYYYNWAMTHRCKIYGRTIDVSTEKVDGFFYGDRYRSGPCFSVMKNEWTFKPVIVSDKEFKIIQKRAKFVYNQIMQDYRRIKRNGFQMSDCQRLYTDIHACKNTEHHAHADQPITYMYIAFRRIRDRGIIAKLRERMVELESQHFILK